MHNIKAARANKEAKTGQIIKIEQEELNRHLDRVVRGTVEQTLNALLDAEADRLCQATRYERSDKRKDTRAGHYNRKLDTKAGQVNLKVPKLRTMTFETAIIERYRRRESSVEEALIEMYLAGYRFGGLKISPRRCGGPGSAPPR
jgi:putative transposase